MRFASDPAETSAMLDAISPQIPRPARRAPAEVAAWLQLSRAILNLDEVVTRG